MSLTDVYLATAQGIARTIENDAIWADNRCNWIGADVDGPAPGGYGPGEVYRALDASLYGGSAGVGLFLAELHVYTREEPTRRTALAAFRHALDHAAGPGLYTGALGAALAAARGGRLLASDEIACAADALAVQLADAAADGGENDLLLGAAGMVIGLLALHELIREPRLLDGARAA